MGIDHHAKALPGVANGRDTVSMRAFAADKTIYMCGLDKQWVGV